MDPAHDYPGYQPRRKRRPPWLGIALAIAVVIIVVLSAVVITQLTNNKSDTPTQAAPSSTTLPASPPPSATPPPRSGTASPTMTCQGYTAAVDPTSQPGWQPTVDKRGLAYAVPPDWTVAKCGARIGWAQPCPQGQCVIREIGAVSTIANPTCEKQNLAIAGVAASKNPDIKAALDEESKTVPIIYTQGGKAPTVEYGPVREFSIGTHPAVQMVATVTDIATDQCTGASAFHSIVVTTVPNVEGSVVFLISLREGTNASPNPDVINKIVKTLRSPA
jgi:hypothetical protein